MKPYPSYKDSGVKWIGKIPNGWVTEKIKYIFWERKEMNDPVKSNNLISLTLEKGVIPHSEKGTGGNKPKDDISKYKLVYPGDIVLNSMNVIVGSVGLSKYFGVVSPVYYMLIPTDKNDDVNYFHHMFRGEVFQKSLIGLGNGILIKHSETSGKTNTIRMRIPMNKLNQERIPYPTKREQQQISNYLDRKIQQIDELIEKTEQKIELLKEKRTSLINHYVTKGLDPNVEMKDSGVEWVGEIPSGWKFTRLKYLFSLEGGKDPKHIQNEDGEFKIYGTGGEVGRGTEFLFDKPSLLLGRKGTIDKPFVVYEPFWISDVMYYTVQKNQMTPYYLWLMFSLVPFDYYRYGSTQPSMSRVDYENMFFPEPPLQEQQQIVTHLDKETKKIDTLIEKENQRTDLLKEYRQSLISEVVTGKIDVRDEVLQ
jgi:type I restriction enzyme, S subunit